MTNRKKQQVKYDSRGQSGDIFAILGQVRSVLQKQQRINDYNELWDRVNHSESYEDALKIINEYVTLVDIRSKQSEM